MDEVTRRRAEEAAQILSSSVFGEIYQTLDSNIVLQWREAKTAEERERLYMEQWVLENIWLELREQIEKAAKHEKQDGPFKAFLKRLKR